MNITKLFTRHITRRGVQISLGLLWLLDGALQLQPRMFTSDFANNVIAPVAAGQPVLVSGPITWGVHVLLTHPAFIDALFALIQFTLGVLILWKRTSRFGLVASAVWALLVWYLGEGLSGMLSGQASLLMGAPGAALIYSLLALAVLPPRADQSQKSTRNKRPAYWLAIVWTMLWVGGAIFQLLPGQNSVSDISSMIRANASSAPAWLASVDTATSDALGRIDPHVTQMSGMHMNASQLAAMRTGNDSGLWFILLLAVVEAAIGLAVLWPGYARRVAIGAGIALSLYFWVVGQNLGGYYTGLATDPSTGPLIILLGITVLAAPGLALPSRRNASGVSRRTNPETGL